MKRISFLIVILISLLSCTGWERKKANTASAAMVTDTTSQYGYNRDFLNRYVATAELRKGSSAILIIPAWQGRVMTSTSEGDQGFSFGWINHDLIASGETVPHINPFGGEERLWLGPEGGQYSIFFRKGAPFIYDEWQTPAFLDTKPFEVLAQTDSSVLFACDDEIVNYSGTLLKIRIEREVILLTNQSIKEQTGIDPSQLSCVAYKSVNSLLNKGDKEWKKETGLLSVWMLGMFNPSPAVVVVIPYKAGDEKALGPPVNDDYFGRIPADRLKVTSGHIFFRADGKSRGKIGIPPLRASGIMGSFDSENNILTLLICRLPEGVTDYVNSAWEIQEDPYSGDALNSYNDGPLEDGSQMGPFYELEASSPAAALKPGEKLDHVQYTLHLTGERKLLDDVAVKTLGVSLDEIGNAFK